MSRAATLSGLRQILNEYGIYPSKRWGQNFLIDKNILNKIADSAELSPETYVVEIGPGMGALTAELAKRCRGVLAIDIDKRLEEILHEELGEFDNIRFLFQDILEVNIEKELMAAFNLSQVPPYQICANIPYNITTPIIFHLLENCPGMSAATLMMQKEVADRILASPGGKDYGLLTLMTSYYAETSLVIKVSHNCFYPRPKVDSSVIKIVPLKEKRVKVKNEVIFKGLLRAAFQKRRKTILNIGTSFFDQDKSLVQSKLESLAIPPANRPETLTIEEFALLADAFSL